MIDEKREKELLEFYKYHLYENILKFWLNRCIDYDHGGYYTGFSNTGEDLESTDKNGWKQGRFVWLLSKLAERSEMEASEKEINYLKLAKLGVDFIKENIILENGHCAYTVTEEGYPKEIEGYSGYDISTYSDCFVTIGFSKYAELTGEKDILSTALNLYDSIIRRIENGEFRTYPYSLPEGLRQHGVPMIALNMSQILSEALEKNKHPRTEEVKSNCSRFVEDIMENFVQDGLLLEVISKDNEFLDSILGSYVNPGHTIEDMWFIMHYAQNAENGDLLRKAIKLAENAFKLGWDDKYGGLFQFVDKRGGKPKGDTAGHCNSEMFKRLQKNWDKKLWWPHTEALYGFLLGYELTDDSSLAEIQQKVHNYTFDTFPNPNEEVGEWIQIRNRKGKPIQGEAGVEGKDPYHAPRSLLLAIELLEEKPATE